MGLMSEALGATGLMVGGRSCPSFDVCEPCGNSTRFIPPLAPGYCIEVLPVS